MTELVRRSTRLFFKRCRLIRHTSSSSILQWLHLAWDLMSHHSENSFGRSRAQSDLCQQYCCMQLPLCIIAPPFRNPTGQNCRSICFTYCALTLHCSYLTLISSYQSQSLAAQVPQQPQVLFLNQDSLQSRARRALGFGILYRLITNRGKIHANVLWHAF